MTITELIHEKTSADLQVGFFGDRVLCTSCDREIAALAIDRLPDGWWSTPQVARAVANIESVRDDHQKDGECVD